MPFYNDTFNHTRLRTFNGDHLTLPGASRRFNSTGIKGRRLADSANAERCSPTSSARARPTMVAAAMELKRLGLARKPMFAVPNHMLGQFSTELLTLYPGANILVAGKEDFESQNRKKLFSRIATGNWDAVIVTHPASSASRFHRHAKRFFDEQLHELEMIRREHADSSIAVW